MVCGVYTCQLAVKDAIKELSTAIDKIQAVIKISRKLYFS
jgi:hypothetical protein